MLCSLSFHNIKLHRGEVDNCYCCCLSSVAGVVAVVANYELPGMNRTSTWILLTTITASITWSSGNTNFNIRQVQSVIDVL